MVQRREFLKLSGHAAALGCLLPFGKLDPTFFDREPKKLKVLIMGGTGFLGPAVVKALKAKGHTITLFNRGRTNTHLFPEVEKLKGDRNKDLSALKGRKWDAVIDNCGYFPRQLTSSTKMLKESGFYLFVSSVSVYPEFWSKDTDETTKVDTTDNPDAKRITNENYGPLKALCEAETTKTFPGNSAIVRPGLIVGPGDPTDRFTYWPARVAKGGEVLAPGKKEWGTQYIDVRDLAEWMVHLCEQKTSGTFNALGPAKPTPFGDLLDSCKRMSKSDAKFLWMDEEFMKANNVRPWQEVPVFLNPVKSLGRPSLCSNKKAIAAGLKFRTLDDTVKATLDFHKSRGAEYKIRGGFSEAREKEIIKLWHKQKAAKVK